MKKVYKVHNRNTLAVTLQVAMSESEALEKAGLTEVTGYAHVAKDYDVVYGRPSLRKGEGGDRRCY